MHPDDIDDLVRAARRTPRTALDRWRTTASRILARDDAGPTSPDGRRQFLRLGGGGVLAAAVLSACGSSEETQPSETGVTTPEQATTTIGPAQTTTPEEGELQDATVARTHRTFELAAIEVYSIVLGEPDGLAGVTSELRLPSPIGYDEETRSALTLLRERHVSHAAYLESVVSAAGGDPVSEPNRGVLDGLLAPTIASLTTQRSVVQLLLNLESLGAATYAWGAGTMTTPELRQSLMTVGAVAARQAAVPALLLQPGGGTVVSGGVLDTSGPARLPEQMLVLEDMDGGDTAAEPPDPAASSDDEDGDGEPDEED